MVRHNSLFSHRWQLVLSFLLGGAVSSLAQDPSDYVFFWATSHNLLSSTTQQTVYWYWIPFVLYFILFLLGIGMAFIGIKPQFLLYFYAVLVIFSAIASLYLPQSTNDIFIGTLFLGTIISLGIVVGLLRYVKHNSSSRNSILFGG